MIEGDRRIRILISDAGSGRPKNICILPVLRIRIHKFMGLLDPDPSVRGMVPDLDPSITKQKK
jgi:hypothetical protein